MLRYSFNLLQGERKEKTKKKERKKKKGLKALTTQPLVKISLPRCWPRQAALPLLMKAKSQSNTQQIRDSGSDLSTTSNKLPGEHD